MNLIQIPKKYPHVQIYAALTMLIEDNNEFIVDKYGRNGRLVNIGDYYLFQPVELLDKNISVYDRNRPIEFKHNTIKFEIKKDLTLPLKKTKVNKLIVEEDDDLEFDKVENKVNDVFEELNKNYILALEFSKTGTKVPRGDDSWYKHCGVVMRKLAKEYPDSRDVDRLFSSTYD